MEERALLVDRASPTSTSSSPPACASGRSGLGGPRRSRAPPRSDPTRASTSVWTAVAEMGVATIGLPEAVGGGGGTVLDVAVALEACAHGLVPGPLLGHRDRVAALLGDEAAGACRRPRRPGAVVGASRARRDVVWDAPSATHLLLAPTSERAGASCPRPAAHELDEHALGPRPDPAVRRRRRWTRGRGAVPVDGSRPRRRRVGRRSPSPPPRRPGIARWCLETAVEYAKVREQFGQPIGSFQAIKHLCAEMLETAEAVTAAAWDAARVAVHRRRAVGVRRRRRRRRRARRGGPQRPGVHPGARRDRVHLRARRPPLPAPGDRPCAACSARPTAFAASLADRATAGVRRRVEVDLDGRDDAVRDDVRAPGGGDRRAARGPAAAGAGRGGLPHAALARAVRARRRRGHPARHRPGARRGRGRAAGPEDRRLGGADDPRARHRRSSGSGSCGRRCSAS